MSSEKIKLYEDIIAKGFSDKYVILDKDWGLVCELPSTYIEAAIRRALADARITMGIKRLKDEIEQRGDY
jgi:hypothetical protein